MIDDALTMLIAATLVTHFVRPEEEERESGSDRLPGRFDKMKKLRVSSPMGNDDNNKAVTTTAKN